MQFVYKLFRKKAEKTEVWLNERDLLLSTETDHPTLKIKVSRFIPHPEFNPLMNFNDISLIELSEPVDILKNHLRPICLPPSTKYEPTDYVTFGFTAGWGQMHFNSPKSDHLRHVEVPLISNRVCNEESEPYYRGRVTTHMMCAGDLHQGGPDACEWWLPSAYKIRGLRETKKMLCWQAQGTVADRCLLSIRNDTVSSGSWVGEWGAASHVNPVFIQEFQVSRKLLICSWGP